MLMGGTVNLVVWALYSILKGLFLSHSPSQLSSWEINFPLKITLSTLEYEWVPTYCFGNVPKCLRERGITLQWTGIKGQFIEATVTNWAHRAVLF